MRMAKGYGEETEKNIELLKRRNSTVGDEVDEMEERVWRNGRERSKLPCRPGQCKRPTKSLRNEGQGRHSLTDGQLQWVNSMNHRHPLYLYPCPSTQSQRALPSLFSS